MRLPSRHCSKPPASFSCWFANQIDDLTKKETSINNNRSLFSTFLVRTMKLTICGSLLVLLPMLVEDVVGHPDDIFNNMDSDGNHGIGEKRGIPTDILDQIPDHLLEKFKKHSGIFDDWNLDLFTINADNTIVFPSDDEFGSATTISLDDLEPYSVFSSSGATCVEEGVEVPCERGTPSILVGYDSESESRVQVNLDGAGNINSMELRKKTGDGFSPPKILQAIDKDGSDGGAKGVFAYIPNASLDPEILSQFKLEDVDSEGDRVRRSLLRGGTDSNAERLKDTVNINIINVDGNFDGHHRDLQSSCTSFREVELAVVVESSYCADVGGQANARSEAERVIADVSLEYEIPGLCFKVTIKYYEEVSLKVWIV